MIAEDPISRCPGIRVAKFGLGLTLKLRIRMLDADNGRGAFTNIFAGKVGFIVLN